MAKTLSSIMSQIERLQKEAASLQGEAVNRIRKEIAKYGLTPEQLFGAAAPRKAVRAKGAAPKAAKFADGAGNTWGGRGKRPDWLRQALAAGRALEEFLVQKAAEPAAAKPRAPRKNARAAAKPKAAPKKRAAARKTAARKPRAKPAAAAN